MRVTNRVMYDTFQSNMQSTLGAFMESNIQGGTQKKINKPSDDPAGMALVLNARRNIDNTTQYQRNVDTAKGWLGLADSTLMQVSSTIEEIKTLTSQAANEAVTAENRNQIAFQIRQLFGQLLNLSNTQFENKSIFAGHKYDQSAFEEGLAVSTKDPALAEAQGKMTATGKTDKSIAVRFMQDGTIGEVPTPPNPPTTINYEWSNDGGKTWKTGVHSNPSNQLALDGVTLTIPPGTSVKGASKDSPDSADGTMLFIRPTAIYKGDDSDANAYAQVSNSTPGLKVGFTGSVDTTRHFNLVGTADLFTPGSIVSYSLDGALPPQTYTVPNPATGKVSIPVGGGSIDLDATELTGTPKIINTLTLQVQPRRTDIMGAPDSVLAETFGTFKNNTLVRIDQDADLFAAPPNNLVNYSYSNDGGNTWIKAVSQLPDPPTGEARLTLPGGYMNVRTGAGDILQTGTQMVIHPDRADLNYEIMKDTYVPVNSVGKDIFGGYYKGQPVEGANLFETIGNLIAGCEFNDTDAISQSLDAITRAHERIETANTRLGGLENRLTLAADVHSFSKLDQQQRLSYTEDIDLTTLLNNLAKQELAYNTVLKSSSMIMQLNLTKFV